MSEVITRKNSKTIFDDKDDAPVVEHVEPAPQAIATVKQSSPLDLLALMVEKGADAANLERMMALAERWQDRQAEAEYQAAMAACQKDMPAVVKDAENSHTKSRYALVETVVKVAKPVYTSHGFSLSFYQGVTDQPHHVRIMADVMHSGGHKETKHMDLPIDGIGSQGGKSSMNAVQGVGSTFTYGQRYLTCKIFNIQLGGEDTDGNWNTGTISEENVAVIQKMIAEVKAANPNWNEKGFFDWLCIERIEDMTPGMFHAAMTDLMQRRKKVQK